MLRGPFIPWQASRSIPNLFMQIGAHMQPRREVREILIKMINAIFNNKVLISLANEITTYSYSPFPG